MIVQKFIIILICFLFSTVTSFAKSTAKQVPQLCPKGTQKTEPDMSYSEKDFMFSDNKRLKLIREIKSLASKKKDDLVFSHGVLNRLTLLEGNHLLAHYKKSKSTKSKEDFCAFFAKKAFIYD